MKLPRIIRETTLNTRKVRYMFSVKKKGEGGWAMNYRNAFLIRKMRVILSTLELVVIMGETKDLQKVGERKLYLM